MHRHAIENFERADALLSSTLDRVDWNAELVRGELGKAVQQLEREPGKGLFVSRREFASGAVAMRYEPGR